MKTVRRLVICLDGTWNNCDTSTNVLHNHSLAMEGAFENEGAKSVQVKFYQEGVGTGPLDRITGGGFGLGLEEHVREAYDWLVQNYQDETEGKEADEIYIFGFEVASI